MMVELHRNPRFTVYFYQSKIAVAKPHLYPAFIEHVAYSCNHCIHITPHNETVPLETETQDIVI